MKLETILFVYLILFQLRELAYCYFYRTRKHKIEFIENLLKEAKDSNDNVLLGSIFRALTAFLIVAMISISYFDLIG